MTSRICLVSKYPPIQGGVSASSYWTARGLAERGHHVDVVTNAHEVIPEYRLLLEPRDSSWLEPRFPVTGGSVRVQQTQPFGPSTYYISPANPFVSKLAGLAIDVIRDGAEIVIARYFEPYGVAGYLAAQATGAKLVLSHSGSDLDC